MRDKVMLALSGGLDSSILAYQLVADYGKHNVFAISFSYNQRHDVELTCARRTATTLGIPHKIIDVSFLGSLVEGVSSMVKGKVLTPLGSEDNMPSSYVPFRNAIFSMIMASAAEAAGCNKIALGLNVDQPDNAEHKYRYWDITPEFYKSVQNILDLNPKTHLTYLAPFIDIGKDEEILIGKRLGAKFENMWTCYAENIVGREIRYEDEPAGGKNQVLWEHWMPCGSCPSCVERAAAFKKVGIEDPVEIHGVWRSSSL